MAPGASRTRELASCMSQDEEGEEEEDEEDAASSLFVANDRLTVFGCAHSAT